MNTQTLPPQLPQGEHRSGIAKERKAGISIFRADIIRQACIDSLAKLNPVHLLGNPVMLVVEIGALITTILFVDAISGSRGEESFTGAIAAWLWFTVLFANFAEAMAEGRGKAQADELRKTRRETQAKKLASRGNTRDVQTVASSSLRVGDLVLCTPGDIIPGDGEVIDGVASVDESAITGESAPVIRESGGDRSAVTGGTRVLSDSTRVPPVTALRSPPASRITGADSPVMADSSTVATPSTTSPSPGMT